MPPHDLEGSITALPEPLPAVPSGAGSFADATTADLRGVLAYPAFRRLWIALAFSSLGDWLGLLATTTLAANLTKSGQRGQLFAVGGVLIFRFLPALVIGPFAGAIADRFERRRLMVVCDIIRSALFISIPLVTTFARSVALPSLLATSFLIESVSLFWIPAKEASVPNLLPRAKLEAANQVSLLTTYGTAPLASLVFAGLAIVGRVLAVPFPFFATNSVELALYFDAATFLFSAFTVMRLPYLGGARPEPVDGEEPPERETILGSIVSGWRFIGQTPLIRNLVIGILGAFAAGGSVIGLGHSFVIILQGGDAGYGLLFGAIFSGLALGMGVGPKLLGNFSRVRLFGLAIMGAGISLSVLALLPNLILALVMTLSVGAFAGVGWVTGQTLLGAEVEDDKRGRTFATVQSLVRVELLLVLAAAPFIAGSIGPHAIGIAHAHIRLDGVTITLFASGVIAALVGALSYRNMIEPGSPPLRHDLAANLPWFKTRSRPTHAGWFIAFEGGDGAGKSTQVALLKDWLEARGVSVLVTREPGGTPLGKEIRRLLLDGGHVVPEAEALLYAADRAQHVKTVIRPALEEGTVVLTDRYVDSSYAYQAGGRSLETAEVNAMNSWATGDLVPDLTVLLDVSPEVSLARLQGRKEAPDRLEVLSLEFHERVRAAFKALAERDRRRYLTLDAALAPELVHAELTRRLVGVLPARLQRRLRAAPP